MMITMMKILLAWFIFAVNIVPTVYGTTPVTSTNLPPWYGVDVDVLYGEAVTVADTSMSESVYLYKPELGNSSSIEELTETYLHEFVKETNIPGFDAFILGKNNSLLLGNFSDLCSSCYESQEGEETLTYTFALWLSLKPNSLHDNQDSTCLPLFGPVGMKFDIDKDASTTILAQVNRDNYKMVESKRAKRVANMYMWNHYAVVVKDNTMSVYCNGVPCDKNRNQTRFANTAESMDTLILNVIDLFKNFSSGCNHVAYDKISFWNRDLTEEEILALRFAPFRRMPTTTAKSNEGGGGGGGGGGGDGSENETEPTENMAKQTTAAEKQTTMTTTSEKQQTESKVTGEIVIPIPTGKPEEQLDFLLNAFNTSGTNVIIDISPGLISAGVDAALGILDGLLLGVPRENDNEDDSSFTEDVSYEGPDDDEVILAIGVSEELFNAMSKAGLTMPVSDDSPGARIDMLKFMNSLIDIDLNTGGEDKTHLDGPSLLLSLESFMQSFFRERNVPLQRSMDRYAHIHCYEKAKMDRLQTNVYMTLSQNRKLDDAEVYVEFPSAAYDDFKYVRMIACVVYDGIQLSLPRKISRSSTNGNEKLETVEVISPINSLLVNYDSSNLKENVSFLFRHREKLNGEETICSFLGMDGTTEWKTDGCVGIDVNTTYTMCFCNHLTNFALLMATDGLVLNTWHTQAATYLTYATLSISVLCLLIALIILIVFKKSLKSKRIRILRNTVLSMLLAHLLFLFGDFALADKTACKVVAACLHYLFLTVFCWMFLMGFQLYTKVRRATKTKVDFLYYILFGWGFPLGIVGTAVGTNTDGYGTVGACWLNPEDHTIWTFVGPAMGILFFNCIVMVFVMRAFVKVKVNKDKETMDQLKSAAKAVIVMLPILGLTWVVGLVVQYSVAFVYIFILFNGLQGLFLFIFHIVMNQEVKNAISGKRKVQATSGITAAFGTTTEDGADSPDIKG